MNIEQSAAAGQSGYSRTFVNAVRTKIYVEQGAKRKRQPEDATGTEKLATSTQSRSDSIQTCIAELNTEMNVEQGATPKRHHKAEIREQIQQLTANVEIIIKQKTITTDNQCTTSDGNREGMNIEQSAAAGQSGYSRTFVNAVRTKIYVEQGAKRKRQPEDATGTEKLATSTQSRSDSIQTCIAELNTEMNVEQGATPKRHHKDETDKVKETASVLTEYCSKGIEEKEKEENAKQSSKQNKTTEYRSQVDVTCQVEGKDLDEWSAVQLLQDTKLDTPLDLSFNIISAEKKCILLELEVPSKVLEDKISFSCSFKSIDYSMREIRAVAYHSNISCMIDGRLKCNLKAKEATDSFCTDIVVLHSDKAMDDAHVYRKLLMEHIGVPHLKVDFATSGSLLLSTLFNTYKFCTDIMILHSDKDKIEAHACQKMLKEHIDVPHLKVDLATLGSPLLSTMFNTCKLVFIFHTKIFESGTKESIENLVYGLQSFKDPQRIIPLEVDKVIGTQPVMTLGYVKDIHDLQFPIFKQKVKKLVVQWSRDLQ
ncbi:unnamed protein product [Mytilus edulis]|uniref:Uncharacterized protein n=1 Tax=Mytilus edulis TaxID=6550 RepID=A0A8S3V8M0_MYTED|nr:unnamed protein product [Mytilus edulis]